MIKQFSIWLFRITHKKELAIIRRLSLDKSVRQRDLFRALLTRLHLE